MKKGLPLVAVFLIMFLVLAMPVFAEGSSTRATENTEEDMTITDSTDENDETTRAAKRLRERAQEARTATLRARADMLKEKVQSTRERIKNIERQDAKELCENTDDRRERIACRLSYMRHHQEEYEASEESIPEVCRSLANKGQCRALYNHVEQCEDMEGRNRNRCLKRVAGFIKSNLADEEPSERRQKARHYISFLLYDLQEKIERAVQNGRIDEESGAVLIDKIVEIKEALLNGESRDTIKPMLEELRTIIQEVKQTIEEDFSDE